MKRLAIGLLVVALLLLGIALVPGQAARAPRIGYAFPAGGQAGTEFEVGVGGQGLEGASQVRVTGGGVEAQVLRVKRPLNGKRFQEVQDKIKQVRDEVMASRAAGERPMLNGTMEERAEALGLTDEELEAFQMTRQQRRDPKRQDNPQLVETLMLKVRVATNAAPGPRELRVLAKGGLSNPVRFQVGTLPEVCEVEPNQTNAQVVSGPLPVVINGQVLPGDVDRFCFEGKAGESVVVSVAARELVPYLADAVPGWFQATVTLRDEAGREVAGADDFRFRPDPAFHLHLPRAGRYFLELHDALYRGREDFVYRVTLGSVPYLTGVFPLGGPVGEPRVVTAEGWDLPKATAVMLPLLKPGVRPVPGPANVLEQVRFATDTLPEVMEQEGGAPQVLAGACIVNGRLDRAGDRDAFQVRLPAGGDFVAEVAARRLGSPVDAQLILTDSRGRVLASNDDCEDKADGLNTHHADARLAAKVPDDGVCRLEIREAQGKGGAAYGYRLTVGPPRPDFEVRVTPSCVNARAGAVVPLTLHVVRRDGFAGPVTVRVADGPPGAALDAAVIPAGQTSVRATLSVPDDLQPGVFPLRWEAVARVDGQDVVRPAVPAEDMLQAFFNRHLVPVREGLLSVTAPRWGRPGGVAADRRSALASVHPAEPGPVRLVPGGTTTVRLTSPRMTAPEGVHLTLQEPPDGVSLATVAWRERACEVVLRAEADKAKPGLSGNLIFEVTSDRVPRDRDGKPGKGARQRVSIGVLPAVPFELAQGGRAESGN